MIILRLLLLLTNLHLKLLSTQGTGADKLLSTQRVKLMSWHGPWVLAEIFVGWVGGKPKKAPHMEKIPL